MTSVDLLHNRPAFPMETVAVAIAFSERLEGILSEAWWITQKLDAKLILVHIGKVTRAKESKLNELLVKFNFRNGRYEIIWSEGDPVQSLLAICKEHIVDLLIAGALEKETIFRYIAGSVSREICRRSKCSVLMLTETDPQSLEFNKLVVSGEDHPKTPNTIATAEYFAGKMNSQEITVLVEYEAPVPVKSGPLDPVKEEKLNQKRMAAKETKDRMTKLAEHINQPGVQLKSRIKLGKPGQAIGSFARNVNADLLVVHSPDTNLNIMDRIFTHDMEYLLAHLPCNLMIVHTRGEQNSEN
jgi:nucleotide-binding universal stress UspA family protein